MRLYADLAPWYPLLTPVEDYVDDAAALQPLLGGARTVLELGCGAGHVAHHLDGFELTLTDLSEDMLALSRRLNPGAEHLPGDMRSLRLGRTFDAVYVHDAIMYLLTREDLLAALTTARAHLQPGGRLVVMPDFVAESAVDVVEQGGTDAEDGRGLRYLEWSFQRPDGQWVMHLHVLLRHPDGHVESVLESHPYGIFPRAVWVELLAVAGFDVQVVSTGVWQEVFVGTAGEDA